jgi:hypothetical protein
MFDEHVHAAFRLMGQTRAAVDNRLTDDGFAWKCRFNGISTDKAPWQFRYASNPAMKAMMERLAQQDRAASF